MKKNKTSNPMEIFLCLDIGKTIIEELKRTCPEEFKKLEKELTKSEVYSYAKKERHKSRSIKTVT